MRVSNTHTHIDPDATINRPVNLCPLRWTHRSHVPTASLKMFNTFLYDFLYILERKPSTPQPLFYIEVTNLIVWYIFSIVIPKCLTYFCLFFIRLLNKSTITFFDFIPKRKPSTPQTYILGPAECA